MMSESAETSEVEELLSDEELIARAKADPDSEEKLTALIEKVAAGKGSEHPGIGRRELTEFLDAIRRTVGT